MAWLCTRAALQTCRRTFYNTAICAEKTFADPQEHATGLEKREIIAQAAGDDDPFNLKMIQRQSVSSKDSPNIVKSSFDSRLVGCICEEDQTHVNWMWLHKGAPRRCECGHWFKLVPAKPA